MFSVIVVTLLILAIVYLLPPSDPTKAHLHQDGEARYKFCEGMLPGIKDLHGSKYEVASLRYQWINAEEFPIVRSFPAKRRDGAYVLVLEPSDSKDAMPDVVNIPCWYVKRE
jgi:hypothetical protein